MVGCCAATPACERGWEGLLPVAAWTGRSLAAAAACALAPAPTASGALAAAATELSARTVGNCGGAGSWRGGRVAGWAGCCGSRNCVSNSSREPPHREDCRLSEQTGTGRMYLHLRSSCACGAEARALALQDLGCRHSFLDCAAPNALMLTVGVSKPLLTSHWSGARIFAALRCLSSFSRSACVALRFEAAWLGWWRLSLQPLLRTTERAGGRMAPGQAVVRSLICCCVSPDLTSDRFI